MNGYVTDLPILAVSVPLATALIVSLFGERLLNVKKVLVVLGTLASIMCLVSLFKPVAMDRNIAVYWMSKWIPEGKLWAPGTGLQVDGLGLFTALIIAGVCFLAVLYSMKSMRFEAGLAKYNILFLTILSGALGFVMSGDLFSMYIMMEIMTLSAAALIAFNNNMHKSIEAGFKYLIVSAVSSSFILLGIILLYSQAHTLNVAQLAALRFQESYSQVTILAFAFMLVGYLVKFFVFPCYSSWTDASTAGTSSVSMLILGTVGSTGIYALIRMLFMIFQVNGRSEIQSLLVLLGIATMLVGIIMTYKQSDLKRFVAYQLICQMGFVITSFGIGNSTDNNISWMGISSGFYGMLNLVVSGSLIILSLGAVMQAAGTTEMDKLGGLLKKLPFSAVMFFIGAASFAGMPLLSGFVVRWGFYRASYSAGYISVTFIGILVSILTLVSFTITGKSVFFGKLHKENQDVKEISIVMMLPMLILGVAGIVGGTTPELINKYLIKPASGAIYDMTSYIDTMFVQGYALKMFKEKPILPNMDNVTAGYGQPAAWVILFFTLLIALIILLYLYLGFRDKDDEAKSEGVREEDRLSSELIIEGSLINRLKKLLNVCIDSLQKAHSGSVNDYVLCIVVTLAVIILYLFAVL